MAILGIVLEVQQRSQLYFSEVTIETLSNRSRSEERTRR